jgi:hypothetical protein
MRLYRITTGDVEEVFRAPLFGPEREGARSVLIGKPMRKFADRPLKVVYVEERNSCTVLPVYPLKKIYWRTKR